MLYLAGVLWYTVCGIQSYVQSPLGGKPDAPERKNKDSPHQIKQRHGINFVFNDDQNITLDYHLFNTAHNLQQSEQKDDFKVKNENKIQWKYSTKDPSGFQCLVDEKNHVNVFKQENFQVLDDLEEVVSNCKKNFIIIVIL